MLPPTCGGVGGLRHISGKTGTLCNPALLGALRLCTTARDVGLQGTLLHANGTCAGIQRTASSLRRYPGYTGAHRLQGVQDAGADVAGQLAPAVVGGEVVRGQELVQLEGLNGVHKAPLLWVVSM